MAQVLSLNVGLPKVIGERRGKPVTSGIDKRPVAERLAVRGAEVSGDGIVGDGQADLTVHGGPDMAIYAYASEDAAWWAQELERDIRPGMFGENLTTQGVDCSGAVIGERWMIGELVLEVCQPRLPCFKLGMQFGDPLMIKRFTQASRPGVYLRVIEVGELGSGDAIDVIDRPAHGVTVALAADAVQKDISLAPKVLEAPQLAAGIAGQLRKRL